MLNCGLDGGFEDYLIDLVVSVSRFVLNAVITYDGTVSWPYFFGRILHKLENFRL